LIHLSTSPASAGEVARSAGEGFCSVFLNLNRFLHDRCEHTLRVGQHFVIPESENLKSVRYQNVGAGEVVVLSQIVLPTVEFDDQAKFETGEIGKVTGDRMLAPESESLQTTGTQVVPDPFLGIGGLLTQVSGETALFVGKMHAFEHAFRVLL
jgi:hypothetical protein